MSIEINGEVSTVTISGVVYGGGVGKSYVDNAISAALGGLTPLNNVRLHEDETTGEKGLQTKFINNTGAPTVKGSLVSASPAIDGAIILQNNTFDTIGIIAESGIEEGAEVWTWKNGSVCQVLAEDGEDATRGLLALAADTDGRAEFIAVPSSNPNQAEHFKEIGHVLQAKAGGANVLVLCEIHFN